jgi:hypothetical protein
LLLGLPYTFAHFLGSLEIIDRLVWRTVKACWKEQLQRYGKRFSMENSRIQ